MSLPPHPFTPLKLFSVSGPEVENNHRESRDAGNTDSLSSLRKFLVVILRARWNRVTILLYRYHPRSPRETADIRELNLSPVFIVSRTPLSLSGVPTRFVCRRVDEDVMARPESNNKIRTRSNPQTKKHLIRRSPMMSRVSSWSGSRHQRFAMLAQLFLSVDQPRRKLHV